MSSKFQVQGSKLKPRTLNLELETLNSLLASAFPVRYDEGGACEGAAPLLARMNGQLNTQPLAELLHEISDARLSGALRLARERVKAAVYFHEGQVVAALMNLRAFRLAEIFRRSGAADEARLGETVREGMSDEHTGRALVLAGPSRPGVPK